MKIGTIELDGVPTAICVKGESIRLLCGPDRQPLADGCAALQKIAMAPLNQEGLDICDLPSDAKLPLVKWLPPVLNPGKIICTWSNYPMGQPFTASVPLFFSKFANALLPCGGTLKLPRAAQGVGWEPELAVVIGRRATHVPVEAALGYVGGYTIANDVTAFDHTLKALLGLNGPYMIAKSFDGFCPIGPVIVTPEEVGDPANLSISLWHNDELRVRSTTARMIFRIEEIVSYLSARMTLEPGDIILTGTPELIGEQGTALRLMQAGDVIRIEIEKIGTLINVISN